MRQNTSHAVMAQRIEPNDSLDFFPTPPWATRALCEWIISTGEPLIVRSASEPACGQGHMARVLDEYFCDVSASDVHRYGYGEVRDYLFGDAPKTDWTITNPPFRLAADFIAQALRSSRHGVAMLVRTSFLEGQERYRSLFSETPPAFILQFAERVPMHKGRLLRDGSTATAYCWLVWMSGSDTRFRWIEPCRKRLERDEDYGEPA